MHTFATRGEVHNPGNYVQAEGVTLRDSHVFSGASTPEFFSEANASNITRYIRDNLPKKWHIWKTNIFMCSWMEKGDQISISFRKEGVFNEDMSSQVCLYFFPGNYHPLENGKTYCASFPLIGRTDQSQIFLWGNTAKYGWDTAAEDLIKGVSAVYPDVEWNPSAEDDLKKMQKFYGKTVPNLKQEYYKLWQEQKIHLVPYKKEICQQAHSFVRLRLR